MKRDRERERKTERDGWAGGRQTYDGRMKDRQTDRESEGDRETERRTDRPVAQSTTWPMMVGG